MTTMLAKDEPPETVRASATPEMPRALESVRAGQEIRVTPTSPSATTAALLLVKASPKKNAARSSVMKGWRFPAAEATPASVRPGLRNMAAYVSAVATTARPRTPGHVHFAGSAGRFCIHTKPRRTDPPISARRPPKSNGGANSRPALIDVKHTARMAVITTIPNVCLYRDKIPAAGRTGLFRFRLSNDGRHEPALVPAMDRELLPSSSGEYRGAASASASGHSARR